MMTEQLIRQTVRKMKPYTPILPFEVLSQQLGRPPESIIKLDANENPYGPSPKALAALSDLSETIHIYPDPESRLLRDMLAERLGIGMEYILIGAGADELIDLIMRLFLDPGDVILDCPPTFSMYAFDAQIADAEVISIPRRADFSLNIDAIKQAVEEKKPKLLFITSPNNPDGSLLSPADLDRLLQLPMMVILDEAYLDFSEAQSAISRVPQTPNLIVLRTFSKWAGLAGMRVGYGIFPLDIMQHLWKMKQPYNLNVAADASARASLEDVETLKYHARLIINERKRLEQELTTFTYLQPYPSHSNFVLCRVVGKDAAELKRQLAEDYGILVRYFNKPGLDDHIRITAGKPEHTDALLAALKELT